MKQDTISNSKELSYVTIDIQKQGRIIRNFRGEVLEVCLEIESDLESFIESAITNNVEEENVLLKQEILSRLSFLGKIEIFKNVIPKSEMFKGAKIQTLVKNLNDLRIIRNDFAHGRREMPLQEVAPYLLNINKGKKKGIKLDRNYVKKFRKLVKETRQGLVRLIELIPNYPPNNP